MISHENTPKTKQKMEKDPKRDDLMELKRQPNEICDLSPWEQLNFSLFGQNPRIQAQAAPQKQLVSV